MTGPTTAPWHYPSPPPAQLPPPGRLERWMPREDLRAGLVLIVVLALAGVLLGFVWQWWSPPGPLGFVLGRNAVQPDETEAWVAADGRFAVLTAAVGLVTGVVMWFLRRSRGPVIAAALAFGGLAGAAVTELVGHLIAGGRDSGATNTVIEELPLSVHMQGLRVLEAAAAVLAYGLCVAFAKDDDLGRPDGGPASVELDDQAQYGGGYGDAAGAFQQPYLPPQ